MHGSTSVLSIAVHSPTGRKTFRLALTWGRAKYGGPFTTEEVEDTKTFFSILLLLLTLVGFHLSAHGYSILNQLMREQCPSQEVLAFSR